MSLRRLDLFLYLVLLTGICVALAPACYGNKPAYIDQFVAPVQHYAVIDLSGTKVDGPVQLMALNDANQAAFAFGEGTAPFWVGGQSEYHIFTWSNGTLGDEKTVGRYEPADWPEDGTIPPQESIVTYGFDYLLPNGWLYGWKNISYVIFPDGYLTLAHTQDDDQISSMDSPSPPFEHMEGRDYHNIGTIPSGVSESGQVVAAEVRAAPLGTPWSLYPYRATDCYYILSNGVYTIFDPWGNYRATTILDNVVIRPEQFHPYAVNERGWAIGSTSGHDDAIVWDGGSPRSLGSGSACGLNNEGQVIVNGYHKPAPDTEGFLWENGQTTTLRDKLPYYYEWQAWDVQPGLLSNQF